MMDLNEGMFAANGGCGYALKPSIMIDSERTIRSEVTTLHLRVISGTDLPKPRGAGSKGSVIDPYVLIEVFGAATDCAEHRNRVNYYCIQKKNSSNAPTLMFSNPRLERVRCTIAGEIQFSMNLASFASLCLIWRSFDSSFSTTILSVTSSSANTRLHIHVFCLDTESRN